ncbi:MAG: hypothetical protein ACOX4R_04670 [Lentihominibacter sp.]|jgi:hypothetical protein
MTMTMVIAIVLAIVFIAFCILCIIVLYANHRETKEFQKKIQFIEQDLGDMSGRILSRLNKQEELLEKHAAIMQMNSKAIPEKRVPVFEEAAPQEQQDIVTFQGMAKEEDWEIKLDDLIDEMEDIGEFVELGDFEDVIISEPAVNPAEMKQMSGDEDDINMLSDILGIENTLNDFDDFTRRTLHGEQILETMVQEPEPIHMPDSEPAPAYEAEPINQLSPADNDDYAVGRSGKRYTSSELEKLIRE